MTKDTIARLREELDVCGCDPDECMTCSVPRKVKAALEEIEAQYMRLPVDADGVPIRPGDELVYRGTELFTCRAVSEKSAHTWDAAALAIGHLGSKCRHVQPETVEGLLEEFGAMFEAETDDIMPLVRDYAERIRKAVDNECQ